MPTTVFVLVNAVLNAFRVIDHVIVMTRGGPDNATTLLLFYVYETGFRFWDTATAASANADPSPFNTLSCSCQETAPAGSTNMTDKIDRGIQQGLSDVPTIQAEIVEVPAPDGPFGAKGVGEAPVLAVAAAVANAVAAATGVRMRQLPMTPQRVWEALTRASAPAE